MEPMSVAPKLSPMSSIDPALFNPPSALLVGFEMPRETAIEWLARSRNLKVEQLSKSERQSIAVHILRIAMKNGFQVGSTGEPLETYLDGSRTAAKTHIMLVSRRTTLQNCDESIPNVEEGPREVMAREYLTSQGTYSIYPYYNSR